MNAEAPCQEQSPEGCGAAAWPSCCPDAPTFHTWRRPFQPGSTPVGPDPVPGIGPSAQWVLSKATAAPGQWRGVSGGPLILLRASPPQAQAGDAHLTVPWNPGTPDTWLTGMAEPEGPELWGPSPSCNRPGVRMARPVGAWAAHVSRVHPTLPPGGVGQEPASVPSSGEEPSHPCGHVRRFRARSWAPDRTTRPGALGTAEGCSEDPSVMENKRKVRGPPPPREFSHQTRWQPPRRSG